MEVKKQPGAATNPESFYQSRPAWRVGIMEMVDPFGWHQIHGNKLTDLREKLGHFESMTWSEILIRDKRRNHFIPRKDICKAAQDRLVSMRQDDVDELVSLRLSGPERVWGILDGDILRVVWWDPEHRVCPSIKD